MFCNECGNKIKENAKFCNKCGRTVHNNKLSYNSNLNHSESLLKNKKKNKNIIIVPIIILTIGVIGIGGYYSNNYLKVNIHKANGNNNGNNAQFYEDEEKEEINDDDSDEIKPINAEEYIATFGTIRDSYIASESDSMLSEKQVSQLLKSKGFNECSIYAHYNIDGEYYEPTEISANSEEKHPNYYFQYTTPNEDIWSIYVINDVICASPVSFIISEELNYNIIYCESNLFYFYDNKSNKYYEVECDSRNYKTITNFTITANVLNVINLEEFIKNE